MLGLERRQTIMERLRLERKVYVSALAKDFKVTEETVRRDLEKLESEGLIRRSYGGAMLADHTNEDISYAKRSSINGDAKRAVAQKAAGLLQDGDTIMVDASTTCYALLQELKGKRDLTVITNSTRLTSDFSATDFTLVSTGGTLRQNSCALTGPMAIHALSSYYVDYAILSCKAIDFEKGLTESNDSEAAIKRLMMAHAKETILLADSSKFNRVAFVKFADLADISRLVTDRDPDEASREALKAAEVELIS